MHLFPSGSRDCLLVVFLFISSDFGSRSGIAMALLNALHGAALPHPLFTMSCICHGAGTRPTCGSRDCLFVVFHLYHQILADVTELPWRCYAPSMAQHCHIRCLQRHIRFLQRRYSHCGHEHCTRAEILAHNCHGDATRSPWRSVATSAVYNVNI